MLNSIVPTFVVLPWGLILMCRDSWHCTSICSQSDRYERGLFLYTANPSPICTCSIILIFCWASLSIILYLRAEEMDICPRYFPFSAVIHLNFSVIFWLWNCIVFSIVEHLVYKPIGFVVLLLAFNILFCFVRILMSLYPMQSNCNWECSYDNWD